MQAFLISIVLVTLAIPFGPPANFPINKPVEITAGLSDMEVALTLKNLGVIRSELLFTGSARVFGLAQKLNAGRYLFNKPLPVWTVLWRVSNGDYGTHRRKVTIPEGFTNKQIGKLFNQEWDDTNQGYLFPDTYFIDQFTTQAEIRQLMLANFNRKVNESGKISPEDLILASLIEEEASASTDRRIISGILKKRLDLGMALQVDVALETYKRVGLPDNPIVNPGLDAISAALNPISSKYLYYLSDKSGIIHYTETFNEHIANKRRYLK